MNLRENNHFSQRTVFTLMYTSCRFCSTKAALDSAQKVQTARTGDASKPVQYKSALARAIMPPPAYDQLEESKVQELSDKDH
ncbi:MAG: hypothetical protein II973_07085 [Spirochaetaceae bacterium]|nr:hypothetical protein [Spirochaetaceae bacterium]